MYEVVRWQMTEEQRQEYIKLHPIKPQPKPSGLGITNEQFSNKGRDTIQNARDYKWRAKKAAEARWGVKEQGGLG